MKEEWRDIKDYEGVYQVSNLGRVRRTYISVAAQEARWDIKSGESRMLSPCLQNGYPVVNLSYGLDQQAKCYVHILVAAAFLGPKPQGHHCHHKDGDRANARLDNLEYLTISRHYRKHFIEECEQLVPGQRGDGLKMFD